MFHPIKNTVIICLFEANKKKSGLIISFLWEISITANVIKQRKAAGFSWCQNRK